MAKPLRSDNPSTARICSSRTLAFLNDGSQSKVSLFTSIALNVLIAIVVIIIGAAAKKTIDTTAKSRHTGRAASDQEAGAACRRSSPKPLPSRRWSRLSRPRSSCPKSSCLSRRFRPIKMTHPVPVVLPAPPKRIQPPPAPKVVNLAQAMPASVVNNSPHPVRGCAGPRRQPDCAFEPARSQLDQSRSTRDWPACPLRTPVPDRAAKSVNLGSGSPGSQNMNGSDNAAQRRRGVQLGVAGGTGPMNSAAALPARSISASVAPPPMPKSCRSHVCAVRIGAQGLYTSRARVHRRGHQAAY